MSGLIARRFPYLVSGFILACSTYSASDLATGSSLIDAGGGASGAGAASGSAAHGGKTAAGGAGGNAGAVGGSAVSGSGGVDTAKAGNASAAGEAGMASSGAAGLAGDDAGGSGPVTLKPIGVTVANNTRDVVHEVNPTNSPFSDRCPAGQVLVGFNGTVDATGDPNGKTFLRSAQGICGTLVVSASPPYAVAVAQASPLPMHEIAAAQQQVALCPVNQVMIGFAGRSSSTSWVDSVDVRCAPLTITGTAPKFALAIGTPAVATSIGGFTGGTAFAAADCAAGDLAVGQIIRTSFAGTQLGAFGVQCATASISLGPG